MLHLLAVLVQHLLFKLSPDWLLISKSWLFSISGVSINVASFSCIGSTSFIRDNLLSLLILILINSKLFSKRVICPSSSPFKRILESNSEKKSFI